jgi:hypothetical protein
MLCAALVDLAVEQQGIDVTGGMRFTTIVVSSIYPLSKLVFLFHSLF